MFYFGGGKVLELMAWIGHYHVVTYVRKITL